MNWYKKSQSEWFNLAPSITLYHGTSEKNLQSILKEGLQPISPDKIADQILQNAGYDRSSVPEYIWQGELKYRQEDPRIHLTTYKKQAADYARSAAKGHGEFSYIILQYLNEWLEEQKKEKVPMDTSKPVVLTIELPWNKVKSHKSFEEYKEIVERIKDNPSFLDEGQSAEDYMKTIAYEFSTAETIPLEYVKKWEYVEEGPGVHELV